MSVFCKHNSSVRASRMNVFVVSTIPDLVLGALMECRYSSVVLVHQHNKCSEEGMKTLLAQTHGGCTDLKYRSRDNRHRHARWCEWDLSDERKHRRYVHEQ